MSKFIIFFVKALLFSTFSQAMQLHEIIHERLILNYNRPVTMLYISQNPENIYLRMEDVIVYWTDLKKNTISKYLQSNCIVLGGAITLKNTADLADCEHFDIAVVDFDKNLSEIQRSIHLADHTIFVTNQLCTGVELIKKIKGKNIYLLSKPKTTLRKGWWQSISFHKDYKIVSNFNEKYFIKPKEYTTDNKEKKVNWIPGVNLYTFFALLGEYPLKMSLREKVIEVFDPAICNDFGLGNLILQGQKIRAIDFDTNYSEDPYIRLKRTIEQQMGMKYN